MTKKLDCFIDDCHATIEAETEEEVMAQAQEHAGEVHPDLELDAETAETIRSHIQDV
jgi:predicted small metal-binding protein